ncbi:UDP-N-acetyl-D-glucosamine dehydrogenase [Actinoplanes campanulatus]|uniref:UDP-N-acetyl-D-glucosamine dehydrogenase n=1 Tax=Actinoplanes campanulatus TaxID=113559 RepID=A0A7W5AKX9_9ACTN|nr:nucleotide sugar dehydrogenase [Actinoplanes campanulatus]MBB3098178.1 UDP-N-acetyl-D-glucosamine dehydrogenase [Actinoplanes campanulatus]GGN32779.1 UDP-N-acetyl-D-glucosamine dehydrogenase [Actinoplanes campanulatus]GID39948.1 UDP-N-acetyl-D-glucosamine dehydrogenase [Actinoplanes campanulatus]
MVTRIEAGPAPATDVHDSGLRVVIVGQGYVGLPLAVRAAEVGHTVIGYDVDERRIKRLAAGESYVEDIPAERLAAVLGSGRFQPTLVEADLAGFDVAVITVPTPLRDGAPDLSYIEDASRTLGRHLRPGALVILESTTYPGTTEEIVAPLLTAASGLRLDDFHLGYSPERIDPGNREWRLENTPKLVSGLGEAALRRAEQFYGSVVERTVPVSSPKVAELSKLIENTFRHVNIGFVNEVAMCAEELGIDVWEAIDAASSKPFGFMRFTPGPGVGGHCLPIDPHYLSWRVQRKLGKRFLFVELANDVNEHMPNYVVNRLLQGLNRQRQAINGSRVLLLGLAYKKNTSDVRESPAVRVAELLAARGADVRAAEPHAVEAPPPGAGVTRVELTRQEVEAADVAVILTDHDDFDYDMVVRHARYVFDCRNRAPAGHANVELL